MSFEIVVSVVVVIWAAVLLLAISLCRAAKLGDEAMQAKYSPSSAPSPSPSSAPSPATERPLRTLDLQHAASLLGVSPELLLTWDERFGFPSSSPSEPLYSESEVLALRDSLEDEASIPSAVAHARERIKRHRAPRSGGLVDHRDGGIAS